jgi:hypothetical protein
MASRNQHVVPHDGGWAIQDEGRKDVTSVFGTKREAIDRGREIANQSGAELVIHGREGQIFRRTDSPGRLSDKTIRDAVRSLSKKSDRPASGARRTRHG